MGSVAESGADASSARRDSVSERTCRAFIADGAADIFLDNPTPRSPAQGGLVGRPPAKCPRDAPGAEPAHPGVELGHEFPQADAALSSGFSIWSGVISASGPVSGGSYGPLISIFPTRAPSGRAGVAAPDSTRVPGPAGVAVRQHPRVPASGGPSPDADERRGLGDGHAILSREQEQPDLLFGVHANLQTGHRQGVQLFVHSPF